MCHSPRPDVRKKILLWCFNRGNVLNIGCGAMRLKGINIDVRRELHPELIADFHFLPFRNSSFDVAFAFDVFEHTLRPEALREEATRVGKNQVFSGIDFDFAKGLWHADAEHVYYLNKKTWLNLFPSLRIFNFDRSFLIAIRRTNVRFLFVLTAYKLVRLTKLLLTGELTKKGSMMS